MKTPAASLPAAPVLASFLLSLPAELRPKSYERIFTPLVTLFYLLGQRLRGWSCQQVVADLHLGGADALFPKRRRRPSRKIISHNTAAFSKARQRLGLDFLRQLLHWQAGPPEKSRSPQYWNKHIRLLDGSTVAVRPLGDVAQRLPPHSNSKNQGYWCLLRVVVSFCLQTGLAVQCAMGGKHDSEQALACQLLAGPLADALYLGDSNFGVLSVVQAIIAARADALLRLTDARARKLLGRAPRAGIDEPVAWAPSAKDQRVQPHAVGGRVLCVRLSRKGFRTLTLCLFTTLADPAVYPAGKLVQLYGLRWQVEINLRHLKSQMGLAVLEAHSAQMNQKEWLAGLIAYNFIRSVMDQAARTHQRAAWEISFSLAVSLILRWLHHPIASHRQWKELLALLARVRPPSRSKPRPTEPRQIRYRARSFPSLRGDRAAVRRALQTPAKS